MLFDTTFFLNLNLIFILNTTIHISYSIQFSRQHFGVVFNPFVKGPGRDKAPTKTDYTPQNVKTMLQVVSTKFTEILIADVCPENGLSISNKTVVYSGSYATVFAPDATAKINLDANEPKLSAIIEILIKPSTKSLLCFQFAYEAALKANKFYPYTIKGIVLHLDSSNFYENSLTALEVLNSTTASRARAEGFLLGSVFYCGNCISCQSVQDIISQTDLVLCWERPHIDCMGNDPEQCSGEWANVTLENKKGIRIGTIPQWVYYGTTDAENPSNFRKFWKHANDWAVKNNISVYMSEAIDNPINVKLNQPRHTGWWRLTRNSLINSVAGYLENAADEDTEKQNGEQILKMQEDARNKPRATNDPITPTSLIISVSVVGCLIVIVVAIGTIYWANRTIKHARQSQNDYYPDFIYGNATGQIDGQLNLLAFTVPYDISYEMAKHAFDIDYKSVLGLGKFCCIYRAMLKVNHGQDPVAIKTTKANCSKIVIKDLLSEIKILIYIGKHLNVVSLHGAYTADFQKGMLYLAIDLCSLGSLQNYLQKLVANETEEADQLNSDTVDYVNTGFATESSRGIHNQDMVRWSYEIACGMEYISSKSIVHANLSANNVLLTENKTAKITDFGLTRRMYEQKKYAKKQIELLPWKYMAIECLKRNKFSIQSDIWSYGVTIWEIFSMGEIPYAALSWSASFVKQLTDGLRLECPYYATSEAYSVMLKCWNANPTDRPSFSNLAEWFASDPLDGLNP